MKMQLCGWQGAHCQPVFEQLACPGPVQDAIVCLCVCVCCFFLNFIILFFPFLSAWPPVSLYTSDEQVVASKQTPVQKSQEKRQPARSTETDTCTSNLTDESD